MTPLMVRCPQNGLNGLKVRLCLTMALSVSLTTLLLLVLPLLGGNTFPSAKAAIANPDTVIIPIISLTKTVSPQAATSGQILVYTLTVTNTSTVSYTQGLVVTDTVPANTVYEAADMLPAGNVSHPDYHSTGTVTWTLAAQLAPSGTLQVWLKVLVTGSLRDGTPIVNDDYGVFEAQSGAVMGRPVTATIQAPMLAIAKEVGDLQVCDGRRVDYTIRVTNSGHLTSNGPFTVTDRLPAATYYAQSSPAGAFDAMSGLITWTLTSPLAPAQSALVSFAVTNPITTPFGALLVNDNYSATAPDVPDAAIGAPVTVTAINMRVGFTSTAHAYTGQPVTFFNTSTGAINYYLWDYGDGSFLDAWPQPTHTFTQEGNYTVTLTANGPCGVVVAQKPLTVTTIIVSLSKSAHTRRITPGDALVYTLTVTNTSATRNTTALVVADTVPANTTFENARYVSPASGNIAMPPVGGTGVVTWTPNAQLAPGGAVQLSLRVKLPADTFSETVITNDAYTVSEVRSGVVTGEPVTTTIILPSSMALTATPSSLLVAQTATLTATVYDQDGLPVVGRQVNFSTLDALGLGAIVPLTNTTDSNGRATAAISSTLPGAKHILAQTGSLSATTFVTFKVGVGEPYTLTLVADPTSPWVTETAHLTATVADQAGVPMIGQPVSFSTPDALGLGAIVPLTSTTDSNGRATAAISSTLPGAKHILAQTGSLSATAFVTFKVGFGEPYTVTLVADPTSPWVTETAHLTATVTDQAGNRVSGQIIAFSSPDSFGTALFSAIVPLTGMTDLNGQVTTTVSSLLTGDKLIIATASNGVAGITHVIFRAIIYTFLPLVMQSDLSPPEASLPGDSTNMGESVNVIDRQSGLDH